MGLHWQQQVGYVEMLTSVSATWCGADSLLIYLLPEGPAESILVIWSRAKLKVATKPGFNQVTYHCRVEESMF